MKKGPSLNKAQNLVEEIHKYIIKPTARQPVIGKALTSEIQIEMLFQGCGCGGVERQSRLMGIRVSDLQGKKTPGDLFHSNVNILNIAELRT